jgi:uncharacterized protein
MRRYLLPGFCVIVLVLALHTMTIASGLSLPLEPVEVVTSSGETHAFSAYIADTPEARSRGLMYVTRLEPDRGMLFDFESPRPVAIWMKNTPLSLDILFIDARGIIARIEPRARPFSTAVISSGADVRAVLELNGGIAAKLGIEVGDKVIHRLFD